MNNKQVKWETWKREAHELKSAMAEAEGSLFLHLQKGEPLFAEQELGVTYDEFLVSENLVKSERWRAFRAAVEIVEPKKVAEMGFTAFVQLSRRSTPARREAYEENVRAFIREHDHPPSEEAAKRMANIVDPPPPRNTQTLEREKSYAQLKEENASLRREVVRLKARIAELEGKKSPRAPAS